MNILHLQLSGNPGGVVTLCRALAQVSQENNVMYFLFSGGTVAETMAREGIPVVIAGADHRFWGKSIAAFVRFCKENRVDVIVNHSNSPIACAHALAAKRAIPEIRLIAYLHSDVAGMFSTRKTRLVYKPFVRALQKKATHIVAISQFVRQSALDVLHADPKKLRVVYNGMRFDTYSASIPNQPGETLRLIYVGRLVPEKGVHLLIEALSLLEPDCRVQLTIVGDGNQRESLEALTRQYGLEDRVSFLGLRMDIPELLGGADFFIHPAVWNEGFGITLIEAMAAGVPCVAFRRGAMPEIIADGQNGFLIDRVSAQSLADGIRCCDRAKKTGSDSQMRTFARKTGEKFDISHMATQLEQLYTE